MATKSRPGTPKAKKVAKKVTKAKSTSKKVAPAAKTKAKAKDAAEPKLAKKTTKKVAAKKTTKKVAAKKTTKKVAAKKTTKKVAAKKTAPKPSPKKAAAQKPSVASPAKATTKKVAARKKASAAKKGKIFASPRDVKILVVDDEPEILELLVPFLQSLGYRVSEAQDGDQALEKILNERPNIVVLDVMMPGLGGWEIARYVRQRAELDPVRIIMATGIGPQTNAATSPLYGADAYLDKPFALEELDRTVKEVIHLIETGTGS